MIYGGSFVYFRLVELYTIEEQLKTKIILIFIGKINLANKD